MKEILYIAFFVITVSIAKAQTNPVEVLTGNQKISADIGLAKALDTKGKWVFFNRTRYNVSYDYTQKPTFGTSLGILFQLKNGLYVGLLGSANSNEATVRTGFYYRFQKNDFSIRSVLATVEFRENPNIDSWAIFQYKPKLNKSIHLFSQIELAGRLKVNEGFIQDAIRSRLGVEINKIQFGYAHDFEQKFIHITDATQIIDANNHGLFIRLEL
jgi:hypothetical protein